jgi:hypothetical protein
MRNTILTIAVVALTLGMNAQTEYYTVETKGAKQEVFLAMDSEKKHTINFEGKTAQEISGMVELAIRSHWKNGDEVIVGMIQGKSINVIGGAPHSGFVYGGARNLAYTYVHYEFRFKDGVLMYKVHFEYGANQSNVPNPFKVTKRSGKPVKTHVATIKMQNESINNFINTIGADGSEW